MTTLPWQTPKRYRCTRCGNSFVFSILWDSGDIQLAPHLRRFSLHFVPHIGGACVKTTIHLRKRTSHGVQEKDRALSAVPSGAPEPEGPTETPTASAGTGIAFLAQWQETKALVPGSLAENGCWDEVGRRNRAAPIFLSSQSLLPRNGGIDRNPARRPVPIHCHLKWNEAGRRPRPRRRNGRSPARRSVKYLRHQASRSLPLFARAKTRASVLVAAGGGISRHHHRPYELPQALPLPPLDKWGFPATSLVQGWRKFRIPSLAVAACQ